jgi:hypothetical protein
MATAAAAEATATAAQQIPRVPGTGWASGVPACGLGTRLYNLWASFAVAEPCMPGCTLPAMSHSTHPHIHITPGPHTDPDITHIHTSTSPPGLTQTQISHTHTHTSLSLCSASVLPLPPQSTMRSRPPACMGPRYVMCRWSCGCRIKVGCGMWCGVRVTIVM